MAVIAKMNVSSVKPFPQGAVELFMQCVCENGLMAHYAPENEDAVFTKYSPTGSCKVTLDAGRDVPEKVESAGQGQVYVLFHDVEDVPAFDDCLFGMLARCAHVDDYGTSKRVFLGAAAPLWDQDGRKLIPLPDSIIPENRVATKGSGFSYEITIDNPAASIQYRPLSLYWVSFYDASKLTMSEALSLARA